MKKFCVVFKLNGIVYYEWHTDLRLANKFADSLDSRGNEFGIVVSDDTKQEFKYGNALQENRMARLKKGYLIRES